MRVALLSLLMVSVSLTGCLGIGEGSGSEEFVVDEVEKPGWQVGDWWLYTFETAQFGEDTARLVVTEINQEEELYMLGISSEREAQRHAVINHNPFLGRVTIGALSVYENGDQQPVLISLGTTVTPGNLLYLVNIGVQRLQDLQTVWRLLKRTVILAIH